MLIVGLGNPGKEYEDTFHNCGFMAVDTLAKKLNKNIQKIECNALTCVTQIGGEKIVLAKPLTYMNNSGEAVKSLLARYQMKPSELIVFYDDIDIPRFSVRVRPSGSAGTHNGMRSIVEKIGDQFTRIRIGVGRNQIDLKDYVLSHISKEDKPLFDGVFTKVGDLVYAYLNDSNFDKLMREGNSIK